MAPIFSSATRSARLAASILLALVLAVGGAAALPLPLPRGALWVVIRSCVLAERTVGRPFPCLAVTPASGRDPGFAVLRAPDRETHVIVTPTVHIPGIESPELRRPEAGLYWRAALDSRRYVVEAAGGAVALRTVGLAINSAETRSQDQLHIHADCFRPAVTARLRAEGAGEAWRPMREPLAGERYLVRGVTKDELAGGNLFGVVAQAPGTDGDLSRSKVLVVEADAPGRFVVAVSRSGRRSIEDVLDHSCKAVRRGGARTG